MTTDQIKQSTNKIKMLKFKRFQFLKKVWEISDGDECKFIRTREFVKDLEFSSQELITIIQYLKGEGLLETTKEIQEIPDVNITHQGIIEMEKAFSEPEEETKYFPPIVNITNIGSMMNSNVQQGTIDSRLRVNYKISNIGQIDDFIKILRDKLPQLEVSEEDKLEIESDVKTIESQLASSRPKTSFIIESLNSIKHILENAASSLIADSLLPYFPALLELFK